MDVGKDFFNIGRECKDCKIEDEIKILINFYGQLPELKTEVKNSYLFVNQIGTDALQLNDYALAEKWGLIGMQYKGIHGLLGEQEFFFGQSVFCQRRA